MSLKKLLDILFSILMENNKFNSFFTEIFVRSFKTKISVKKILNIFFSIFIENNVI